MSNAPRSGTVRAMTTALRVPPGPSTPARGLARLASQVGFVLDPLGTVAGRFARYGDLYFVPDDGAGLYVGRHPDHLRDVLVTHASKYAKTHTAFRQLSTVLGDGLLTTDGEVWKRQRRLVQPAFHRARLDEYALAMADETRRALDGWRDGETRDLSRDMMELTLHVVSRTLFGHDVSGEVDAVADAMRVLQSSVMFAELIPPWLPSPPRRRVQRAVATLDGIIHGMIDRRAARGAHDGPADLLQMLVTAVDAEGDGRGLSRKETRDQLVTLFLAGHETTSHALTWTLYLLSQNPDAERALHAELDAVLAGRAPTAADLDALPYTDQVLRESMRLYPPAYMVARQATDDTELGGYPVPRGAEVVLWIYMTQRDPRWFTDHAAFRPERFSPEEESKLPRFAWAPFGAGPRACIGRAFAMMEARLILAMIAQRFRATLVPGHPVEVMPRVTLMPRHGMKMTLRARG